jgi:hypothetical protein
MFRLTNYECGDDIFRSNFEKRDFTQGLVKTSVISTIVNYREVIGGPVLNFGEW